MAKKNPHEIIAEQMEQRELISSIKKYFKEQKVKPPKNIKKWIDRAKKEGIKPKKIPSYIFDSFQAKQKEKAERGEELEEEGEEGDEEEIEVDEEEEKPVEKKEEKTKEVADELKKGDIPEKDKNEKPPKETKKEEPTSDEKLAESSEEIIDKIVKEEEEEDKAENEEEEKGLTNKEKKAAKKARAEQRKKDLLEKYKGKTPQEIRADELNRKMARDTDKGIRREIRQMLEDQGYKPPKNNEIDEMIAKAREEGVKPKKIAGKVFNQIFAKEVKRIEEEKEAEESASREQEIRKREAAEEALRRKEEEEEKFRKETQERFDRERQEEERKALEAAEEEARREADRLRKAGEEEEARRKEAQAEEARRAQEEQQREIERKRQRDVEEEALRKEEEETRIKREQEEFRIEQEEKARQREQENIRLAEEARSREEEEFRRQAEEEEQIRIRKEEKARRKEEERAKLEEEERIAAEEEAKRVKEVETSPDEVINDIVEREDAQDEAEGEYAELTPEEKRAVKENRKAKRKRDLIKQYQGKSIHEIIGDEFNRQMARDTDKGIRRDVKALFNFHGYKVPENLDDFISAAREKGIKPDDMVTYVFRSAFGQEVKGLQEEKEAAEAGKREQEIREDAAEQEKIHIQKEEQRAAEEAQRDREGRRETGDIGRKEQEDQQEGGINLDEIARSKTPLDGDIMAKDDKSKGRMIDFDSDEDLIDFLMRGKGSKEDKSKRDKSKTPQYKFSDLPRLIKEGYFTDKELESLYYDLQQAYDSGEIYGKSAKNFLKGLRERVVDIPKRRAEKEEAETGDVTPEGFVKGQIKVYTPEQEELLGRAFKQSGPGSYLQRLASGDEELFREMEAPAQREFQEKVGQLGSRFAELAPGARSARRGSGFQNAANQAAIDFATQMASKRQDFTRQAQRDLSQDTSQLLGYRPTEKFLAPKNWKPPKPEIIEAEPPNPFQDFLGRVGGGLGTFIGNKLVGG